MAETAVETTPNVAPAENAGKNELPADNATEKKVLKRVPKPDQAAQDAAIAAIQAEIKKLEEKRAAITKKIEEKQVNRQGVQGQAQVAREELARIREEKDRLMAERSQLYAERDAMKAALDRKVSSGKNMKQELKFTSIEDIENEIRRLEQQQNTTSMSLSEEKKMIKEIEALKASRKLVSEFASQQSSIKKDKEESQSIRQRITAKNEEITQVLDRMGAQKKVLDEIMATHSGPKEEVPALIKERDVVKKQIDGQYDKIRALRAEFREKMNQHYAYMKEVRAQKRAERIAEQQRRKEEYEAKMKALEEEELKKVPYEEEMALCDYLVEYLQKSFGEKAEEKASETSAASAPTTTGFDGMQPLKREEEDFIMMGGAKKKKGKKGKRQGRDNKSSQSITHNLDVLESFALLSLAPPPTTADVEKTVDQLKAKKEHFKTLPRPEKKKAGEEASGNAASAGKGKKKASEFKAGEQDFPSLSGQGEDGPAPAVGVYAVREAADAGAGLEGASGSSSTPEKDMSVAGLSLPSQPPSQIPSGYMTYEDDAAFGKSLPSLDSLEFIHMAPEGEAIKAGPTGSGPLVVYFWGKVFKGEYSTMVQMSALRMLHPNTRFLGVSLDASKEDAEKFVSKLGTSMPEQGVEKLVANFPLAFDADKQVKNAFQALAGLSAINASQVFLVNADGQIVWREQLNSKAYPLTASLLPFQLSNLEQGKDLISNGPEPEDEEEEEEVGEVMMGDDPLDAFAD